MSDPISRALAEARRSLLDLSTRNRLLSLPATGRSAGVIPVAPQERAEATWRLLTAKRIAMGFAGVPDAPDDVAAPRRRKRAVAAGAGSVPDPEDRILSTPLTDALLATRLTRIERDARGFVTEQGINILHLAIGQLVWRDPKTPDKERSAPLLLLPCVLERGTAADAFRLRWDEGDVVANLTLAELLAQQFRITLPKLDDVDERDGESWAQLSAWFAAVGEMARGVEGFSVAPDAMAVGLFSFAKYLMMRDLERPAIAAHPAVRALLGDGSRLAGESLADDTDIDALIPVERLDLVMDSDGSQTLAAEAVRKGANLVIQGPPGTGKSQVITNIVAQAVLDGRRVLFVAEKLAALQVVKRRLDQVGLGAACLELHSNAANRRAVLADLDSVLKAPRPAAPDRRSVIDALGSLRGRLNRHAAAMHAPIAATGWTAFRAIGEIARLHALGIADPGMDLPAADWTAQAIADATGQARELAAIAARIGTPAQHPWRGVGATGLLPGDATRIAARIPPALRAVSVLQRLAATRGVAAQRLRLLDSADAFAAIKARAPGATQAAWTTPGLEVARSDLAGGGGFFSSLNSRYRAARDLASAICSGSPPDDPLPLLDTVIEGQRFLDAAPEALTMAPDTVAAGALRAALADVAATLDPLLAELAVDPVAAFGDADPPLATVSDRLAGWAGAADTLGDWLAWARAAAAARGLGLDPMVDRIGDGRMTPQDAPTLFRRALAESLMRASMRANPGLAAFDGPSFSRLVEQFREADTARITLARAEAAAAHAARLGALLGRDVGAADAAEAMGVLRGEIARKRGHLPVRALLSRAAAAVQVIKPVIMMSPLSVAQFLDPDAIGFDLLVIDEASQIEPVDALGAIARAGQIVVVGDDRQMPPTRFFARMTSEDEDAPPDEPVATSDVESILSLCNARGVPSQMLRWHYRSRHESLIATSNREFYDGRLLVIPSPRPRGPGLGLSLVRVDGVYDTETDTNAAEVAAIVEAVMRHARETPSETLGVATFSVSQREAIDDALEAARRAAPETEPFFNKDQPEPFFIKNLENVQGDERDVMMISIAYGRLANGKVSMRFGPISALGGERRLNVLITRAKKRCIVFSNLAADDIDLDRAGKTGGEKHLKAFLRHAAAATDTVAGVGEDPAALSEAIGGALESAGLSLARRVGLSGLFVDIATRDPANPEVFNLGILTDGDFYASARSARDRDRLQEAALKMMGWTLQRSWALDWLVRPEAEARRLAALAGAVSEQATVVEATPIPGLSVAYVPASLSAPGGSTIETIGFAKLGGLLAGIVRAEAPVHTDAAILRAAEAFGVAAPSAKQRAAIQQALRLAGELEGLVAQGPFWTTAETIVTVRDRSALPDPWRQPAWLPPEETRFAILAALGAAAGGIDQPALIAATIRLLGVGTEATGAITAQIAILTGEGRITETASLLRVT